MADTITNGEPGSSVRTKYNAMAGEVNTNTAKNSYPSGDAAKVANVPADTNAELAGKAASSHTHPLSDVPDAGDLSQADIDTLEKLNAILGVNLVASINNDIPDNFGDLSLEISGVTGLVAALAAKEAAANKGQAGGYAELDGSGKVPTAQLPSFVDDVLEYANEASFPATGETGKIYVALDVNKTFRWTGSVYTEISASLALGETSSTAYRGDRGKTAYDHSQATGNPHSTSKSDVGLGNVDNTADANKPVSTPQQAALDGKADTSHTHEIRRIAGALGDEDTDMATGVAFTEYASEAFTATRFYLSLKGAPAGAAFIVDIHVNGVSILSSPLSVSAGNNYAETTSFATTAISKNDKVEFIVDQVGTTTAGNGPKASLFGT